MLHLIFQSPIKKETLARIDDGDAVVFLQDAVLTILAQNAAAGLLMEKLSAKRLYVLSDDLEVRGLEQDRLISAIEVIDTAGLVELTVANEVIQSWI